MSIAAALVMAAIEGIKALKDNDDAKIQRQEAINAKEQEMFDRYNAEMVAKRDRRNGVDPSAGIFARELDSFRNAAQNSPTPQDWTPLVRAVGKVGSAIYDESNKPEPRAAPSGVDVPGRNFSPADNYTKPVNYSDWEPVQAPQSNFMAATAKRFEDDDERSKPEWLR